MPQRPIDEEEYNFLQQRRQVADFVEGIYNDPALANEAKALIKKKYPQLSIPDYDMERKFDARFDQERKDREEQEKKKREKEQQEHFAKVRKQTQDDYGFTDEAMERLEKMMVDRNIGDYEVAASYMASKEPPRASDPTFDSTRWHHEKQDGFKAIAEDPEAWARNEIMGALTKDARNMRGAKF